jgi:hypothetical protein
MDCSRGDDGEAHSAAALSENVLRAVLNGRDGAVEFTRDRTISGHSKNIRTNH